MKVQSKKNPLNTSEAQIVEEGACLKQNTECKETCSMTVLPSETVDYDVNHVVKNDKRKTLKTPDIHKAHTNTIIHQTTNSSVLHEKSDTYFQLQKQTSNSSTMDTPQKAIQVNQTSKVIQK